MNFQLSVTLAPYLPKSQSHSGQNAQRSAYYWHCLFADIGRNTLTKWQIYHHPYAIFIQYCTNVQMIQNE